MTRTPAYGMMAIIQLTICAGMIVLMLEEMRGEATSLRVQVRTDAWLTHKLQKEIDLSENKYRHIFEHASDGIFIVDPSSLQILEVGAHLPYHATALGKILVANRSDLLDELPAALATLQTAV